MPFSNHFPLLDLLYPHLNVMVDRRCLLPVDDIHRLISSSSLLVVAIPIRGFVNLLVSN